MSVSEIKMRLNIELKKDRDKKNNKKKKTDKEYINVKKYLETIQQYFINNGVCPELSTIRNWYDGKAFPEGGEFNINC